MRSSKTKGVTSKDRQNDFEQQAPTNQLHRKVILPFLAGVKCNGFYLYGSPLIYTQEVIDEGRPSRISIKQPNLTENNPFSIENLCDLIEDSFEEITLPKFSSVIPGTVDFEGFRERVR